VARLVTLPAARAGVRRWFPWMAAVPIVAALLLAPVTARAQVRRDTTARRDTTTRRDTIRAPGDTLQRDSTAKFEVEWAEPDSIMSELLSREGYTATKYQGERVEIRAKDKSLKLSGKAAVGRPDAVLAGRTGVSAKRLSRLPLLRSIAPLADLLAAATAARSEAPFEGASAT